ncbi:MAG: prepilin-type N-terminal cleavage/methylation domain-containing protein [Myxococcales bacterium]|nr:prepilin-type N-terminal cleavage/methylation domain-containing protein [Myxococcales bacterium]
MRQNKGFSLVELMIVVAIIGILAAIAIPNFARMQLKSKRAEVPGNVDGIKTAEVAYEASYNAFIDLAANPGSTSKTPQAFNTSVTTWDAVGWEPDGLVRGNYEVTGSTNTDFNVTGSCDVDGDANAVSYSASMTSNATIAAGQEDVY